MRVELRTTKDIYSQMKEWWEGHNFPVVNPSLLPHKTFVCYNDNDIPVYSVCFYNTDSNLCWIGWEISNPNVDKSETKGCFAHLFKVVESYAKHLGYDVMFTTTDKKSIEGTLTKQDWYRADENVNHLIKEI